MWKAMSRTFLTSPPQASGYQELQYALRTASQMVW
jgi:hypothetical protein